MTIETLRLRPAEPIESHADLVMRWRNDPTTLAMFYHHEPKTWDRFWPEFRTKYFSDPSLPPAFAVDATDGPVAFLRFQRVNEVASPQPCSDISINVAPEHRGKGYGVAAIAGALPYLSERGFRACYAEVRVENHASQKAFVRAGFGFIDEVDKRIEDTRETCRIRRYLIEL